MAKIAELKKEYEGQWLAIVVTKESETTVEEGDLIFHSKDRHEVWRHIKGDERKIYVTYAGPPLPPRRLAAF